LPLSPIIVMWLWNMLYFLAMGFTAPYFPVLLEESGLTPSQIGLAFTISSIASGLFSYYMGRLSDRVGRLKILISTTLLASISFMLLSVGFNPMITVALFTLGMMGGGAANALFTAFSIDALEHAGLSRGIGFGRIRVGGNIGFIIGTLSGGVLVSAMGLGSIFFAAAIVIFVSALSCIEVEEVRMIENRGEASVKASSLLRGSPGIFLIIVTLVMVVNSAIMNFLSLHLINTHGASALEISVAFALMALSDTPAMIYLGKLSDRIGRAPVLLLCLAVWPLRLTIIGLSPDRLSIILAQALSSFTFGGFFVVSIAQASELVSESARGAYMGLYSATFSMGGVIGGYLWGSLAEATSYASMFLYTAIFSLVPIALSGLILMKQRRVEVYSASPTGS